MALVIIDDNNWRAHVTLPTVDGETKRCGLVPRDYNTHPVGYLECAKPFDLPLIPRDEWKDRLEYQKKTKSRLIDVRNRGMDGKPIPSRDQNGKGYCWAHSGVSCNLLLRAASNQPYADLSAYAVACIIKNYRDQGGWGTQGIEFMAERGVPTSEFWPQKSMKKENDKPETWENAKLHKIEEWMDLQPRNVDQFVTCLLSGIPVVCDYNWWGHSVCGMCLEEIHSLDPVDLSGWILNSWGDGWSENGAGILRGKKFIPDGAVAPRVVKPATK